MKKFLALAAIALSVSVVSARSGSAEDLSGYRGYVLGTSLARVAQTSGTAASEARTTHERPVKIQSFKWRAPYRSIDAIQGDPVRDILFKFADDALYQIVVTYDTARVEGLTDDDLIDVLSRVYGEPALVSRGVVARSTSPGVELAPDTLVVARWDGELSTVMLTRGMFSSGVQLVLTSTPLYTAAREAMTEAVRLDASEAPQRELDARTRQATTAAAAQAKARTQNKAAFKP